MADDALGGYRLVRQLGEGDRADVYLGHPTSGVPGTQQVALKVFRAHVSPQSVAGEVDALVAAQGEHVVGLLDLAVTGDRRIVLILERLGPRSLADLLGQRAELATGEATTILVPLARTLERLHRAGVAHGRVAADSVLFTAEGSPVLACFGAASLTGTITSAARAESRECAADREDFGALASAVLAASGDTSVAEWLATARHGEGWAEDFAVRMFSLGPAAPVNLAPEASEQPIVVGPRVVRPTVVPARRRRAAKSNSIRERLGALAPAISTVRGFVSTVRARFWVIGASAIALLVAGLVLVPEQSTDATSSPSTSPSPLPAGPAGPTAQAPPTQIDAVVTGDDPLAALDVLLAARNECFRAASILCLDAVAQPGSAAMLADQETIRALQGAASPVEESPVYSEPWTLELEEQLGGAALVAVTTADSEPASILMIRSEAGWRIRDYVD